MADLSKVSILAHQNQNDFAKWQTVKRNSTALSNSSQVTDDSSCKENLTNYKNTHTIVTPSEAGATETYFWVEDLKNWCTYKKITSDSLSLILSKSVNHLSQSDYDTFESSLSGKISVYGGPVGYAGVAIYNICKSYYSSILGLADSIKSGDVWGIATGITGSVIGFIYDGIKNTITGVGQTVYNWGCSHTTKHGKMDDLLRGTFGLYTWNGLNGWNPFWEYLEFSTDEYDNILTDSEKTKYRSNNPVFFYPSIVKNKRMIEHRVKKDENFDDGDEIVAVAISDGIIINHNFNYSFLNDTFQPIRNTNTYGRGGQYTGYRSMRMTIPLGAEPIVRLGSGELMLGLVSCATSMKSKYHLDPHIKVDETYVNDICVKSFTNGSDKTATDWMNFWPTLADPTISHINQTEGLISTMTNLPAIGANLNSVSITLNPLKPVINIQNENTPTLRKW